MTPAPTPFAARRDGVLLRGLIRDRLSAHPDRRALAAAMREIVAFLDALG